MELKILCVMSVLNIVMLIFNVWMRIDSEKTIAELKERTYTESGNRRGISPQCLQQRFLSL